MRSPFTFFIVALVVNLLADLYIWRAIRSRCPGRRWLRWAFISLVVVSGGLLADLWISPFAGATDSQFVRFMWIMLAFVSLSLGRWMFVVFDLIGKVPRLFGYSRWKPLAWVGIGAGALTVIVMWVGAFVTRHQIEVKEVTVPVAGLPPALDGLTIVQISDLHCGTWLSDTTFVSRLTDAVNSLDPDVVAFTGDLVSRHAAEAEPMMPVLARLHGRDGVFAILGNHDYAAYFGYPDTASVLADRDRLRSLYRRSGITLLEDSAAAITRGSDTLILIGVGNIGRPPFPVYGSLSKAYPDVGDSLPKVLLSHDPDHWLDSIARHETNIALTLSGHTHAMQMSILGWSPSSLMHEASAGLYDDGEGHRLYVNTGLGTVGVPMRVGAKPEITFITLKSAPRP